MSRGKKAPLKSQRKSTGVLPATKNKAPYILIYPTDSNIEIEYNAVPTKGIETAHDWAKDDERWVCNEPLALLTWKASPYPEHVQGMAITIADGYNDEEYILNVCFDAGDEYTELFEAKTYKAAITRAIKFMNDEDAVRATIDSIFGR
jgi:hypothetical protein